MFIKGPKMQDVCFQVYELEQHPETLEYHAHGRWWNIANGDPFPLNASERITIKNYSEWKAQSEPFKFERLSK